MKIISQNKKAYHDYFILNEYEAGIVLMGSEIKALRNTKVTIQQGYIDIDDNYEVFLYNVNIPVYQYAPKYSTHSPMRKRKLLLNKKEINKLYGSVKIKGLTIIPLSIYFNDKNYIKLKIAIAKGKKMYDKREALKEKDWQRNKDILIKEKY